MTTDNATLANALYGDTPTPAAPAGALYPSAMTSEATPATPPGAGPTRAPTPHDESVTAAALFDGGEPAPSAEVYDSVLNSGFDAIEQQARFDGNAEDVAFFQEARQQAAGLMNEMQIPVPLAREITVALSAYSEALSDDALEAQSAATETELRAEWGSQYEANVAQARRVYAAALAKMPSLRNIIEAGAGSDAFVIRAFFKATKRGRRP